MDFGTSLEGVGAFPLVLVVVVVTVLPGEGDLVEPLGVVFVSESFEPRPVLVVTTRVTTVRPPTVRGGVLRVTVVVLMRLVSDGALSWEPSRMSRLYGFTEEILDLGVCLVWESVVWLSLLIGSIGEGELRKEAANAR